jgi:hypothetical protein
MTSKKLCPHCLKVIPFKHRFKRKCPHCFRPLRRRSDVGDRTLFAQWLEDRGKWWWLLVWLVVFTIGAMIGQLAGHSSLLQFMSNHPVWFGITLYYLSGFSSIISRIYFPLMLDAPRILRRERPQVKSYKVLTTVGIIAGLILAVVVMGTNLFFLALPGSVFLFTIPIALMWAYLALVLTDSDYEDERVWSYMTELGASERLDHRHHGYMVLIMLPLSTLLFYWMMKNQWLYYWFRDSVLIAMFKELWNQARGGA